MNLRFVIAIDQPCMHGSHSSPASSTPFPIRRLPRWILQRLYCNHSYRIALSVNCYIFKAALPRGEAKRDWLCKSGSGNLDHSSKLEFLPIARSTNSMGLTITGNSFAAGRCQTEPKDGIWLYIYMADKMLNVPKFSEAQMHAKAVRPSQLRKETSLGGGKSAATASGVVTMITAM